MQNHLFKGFIFSLFVLVFLAGYPFLHENIPFLDSTFKQTESFDFFKSSLNKDESNREAIVAQNQITFIQNIQGEMSLKAYVDSIATLKKYTGSQQGLVIFFQSLLQTEKEKKGTTRIAYFGDSMIEGDLITKTVRKKFQQEFGGEGIGFMPITSITNEFRVNIKHEFSNNWKYNSLTKGNKTSFPFGISGEIFTSDSTESTFNVAYTAVNAPQLSQFPIVKLYYGKGDSLASYLPPNTLLYNEKTFELNENNLLNIIELEKSLVKKVQLAFSFNHNIPIYGVSMESSTGVILDNFSLRGNSGLNLTSINNSVLKAFDSEMNIDLIVLQFGLNVLSGKTNYVWYKSGMKRVITHLKNAIPNASILLVGVADKSSKNEKGNMETDIAVPLIIDAQREAARETEVAFFNLYEAMGGENSMVKWVEELEYANKDYTHFNFKGADLAGSLIHNFLIEEYEIFKKTGYCK